MTRAPDGRWIGRSGVFRAGWAGREGRVHARMGLGLGVAGRVAGVEGRSGAGAGVVGAAGRPACREFFGLGCCCCDVGFEWCWVGGWCAFYHAWLRLLTGGIVHSMWNNYLLTAAVMEIGGCQQRSRDSVGAPGPAWVDTEAACCAVGLLAPPQRQLPFLGVSPCQPQERLSMQTPI